MLDNARKYAGLRMDAFERSIVDKLTKVISALIMGLVIFIVSLVVVVFFSAAIVVALAPHVGGYLPALLIVGTIYIIVLLMVYSRRHTLIAIPIRAALSSIFLADRAERPAPTDQQIAEARQNVIDDYTTLTAPPPPANNKFEQAMQTASKAWSIADGVITGYKLYKRFGGIFRGKRHK